MKCMARKIAGKVVIAALAAASPLMAPSAHAIMKELKFHVVQDQFTQMPTLEMRYDGDKWVWANKDDSFNIKVKVKIRTIGNKFDEGTILVPKANMALWQMPAGLQTREYETLDTVNVGKAMLTNFQGDAANLCSVFGGEKKSVRDLEATAVLSAYHSAEIHTKNGILPLKVVCQPKEPHRAPVDLKVTQLKVYTLPAAPKCGQPVHLVTEIHTNKPGKVDFQLFRKDGEKQAASLTTEKVANGYAKRWSKKYVYNQSIKREYLVTVTGHAFSSEWVAVDVKCGAKVDIKRPLKLTN